MNSLQEFSRSSSHLFARQSKNIGYPVNLAYDYAPFANEFAKVFSLKLNNVGPVETESLYSVNSKAVERSVMKYVCDLWSFDEDRVWGYVTSSGTEGNLQALYVARELFPDAVMYFSRDSHYSIKKIARVLKVPFVEVDSLPNGEIDCGDFETKLIKNGDLPAIVVANIGTTMKGAYDDVEKIAEILAKNGKSGRNFVHADAALMGWVYPLAKADVSFKRHVHSISISGHKFQGVPFPCGVVVVDSSSRGISGRSLGSVSNFVEYIDCADCTIPGSRSGVAPLFLAHIIEEKGFTGFAKDLAKCFEVADVLIGGLLKIGVEAWRNDLSLTVVLPRPSDSIVRKWQLASEGGISHVVVMPHVTEDVVNEFLADVRNGEAF